MTHLLLLKGEIISQILSSVSQTLVVHRNTEARCQNPAEVAHEPLGCAGTATGGLLKTWQKINTGESRSRGSYGDSFDCPGVISSLSSRTSSPFCRSSGSRSSSMLGMSRRHVLSRAVPSRSDDDEEEDRGRGRFLSFWVGSAGSP